MVDALVSKLTVMRLLSEQIGLPTFQYFSTIDTMPCIVFREGEESGCLYVVLSGEYAMFTKVQPRY